MAEGNKPPSHRVWTLTVRRFVEVAWTRHGPVRYVSVGLTPILVALLTPGWWWALCAAGAIVGAIVDLRTQAAFQRLCARIEDLDEAAIRAAVNRHIRALAVITTVYVAPYAALAFAPPPAPMIGLLFCAGSALICATLHIMTRTMILWTIPMVIVGLAMNASSLGTGMSAVIIALMAGVLGVNAVMAARAGASSFGDLIAARLEAEAAAEDLERRVLERTRQLAVATKRAQTASKAKSMFLANMSHELRTPLNAVIGYAEIIQEDLESGETESSAADLDRIRNAASHLLAMINEVLDLSRIEAGKLDLRPTTIDLHVLLRGAMDTVRPTAAKQRTVCQVNIAPGVETLVADETRVRQCVLNLLSNAAKFTQNGVVALDARACRIGSVPGLAISVRDTGPGISAEQLERLFKPFVQVDASHTRAHDVAGLGLVITQRLARAMGGDVQAHSKLGQGSTFTLYLPAKSAPARVAA